MTALPQTSKPLNAEDQHELVRRIVTGDTSAFESLMRRHNRRLYRLARATLRNDSDAEDALQAAYLSAFRSMERFRGDSTLFTWLSRLVLNECFARLRRQKRRQNVIPIVDGIDDIEEEQGVAFDDDAPDRSAERAELRALLERKLDELPEIFRVVFVMRSVEEMTVEETAESLGIPEATVRSRHFRARSMLREWLAQELDLAERDVFDFGGVQCDRVVARVLAQLSGTESAGGAPEHG
ncbi:RNA polymerase sigma factor [Caballeronia arationis]|jgi:RNA polymerase sigma-70 factor (ECF subfamily)|uniref:RNA polymerase, sigma-24 subunit, RpoE n=1 Tax=Caballeronia arationis TaxID=1777142 RepID=A0A7Z7N2F4_9BURK|nr:RNA polymerase sigma factor [Caballeronia arationis]SAL01907.1 RNA polymerase sigma factor [Caballeronia arationis]SOE64462.1 RNA polymerase, sigma-24 subunit, RpoE [Caballeronia arationis]